MTDLEKAKMLLQETGATCVLCRGKKTFISRKSGIAPMLDFLTESVDLRHFSAADRIIGKAAAMLFVLAGVESVYGAVVSRSALTVLEAHEIRCVFEVLTDQIRNRSGDGICPMEKTVQDITDPGEALEAIRNTQRLLFHGSA